jgi:ABC-type dipeptide/oligopeptide/nickel transport system permease component
VRTYILRRLAITFPILLGLTIVTFVFTELMPGDFVDALVPPTAIVA